MKLIKLTALPFIVLGSLVVLSSCESDAELKKTTDFQKTGIVMSGAKETPAVPSAAIGKLDVFYTRETRTLSYTVTWSGLTDSVNAMHIHGLAPEGYAAGIVQNIVATSNSIFAQKTSGKYTYAKSGTLSGTLLVDGTVIKENDLLNGQYYLNIHTSVYPGGEIRGQITFQ
ncbi:MAG: CHRD domain-containing protein [Chitinophagaceae bacterium]|nr:CHRD domain-containing protein [Chitinophagaceae bacterium]